MKIVVLLLTVLSAALINVSFAQETKIEDDNQQMEATFFAAKTVAFIGDSITYHGGFLVHLESTILANGKNAPTLLNVGLSSETCSGCSEPAHPWPRPDVHERFGRLIAKVKPDLLIVNYGMNDGIYHPFDQGRFEKYKAGINKIIEAAQQSDGSMQVILVTPPPFDPLPVKTAGTLADADAKDFSWKAVYENYDDEVIAVYSDWILKQKNRVAGCVDLRTPFLEALVQRRKDQPNFWFAKDGVHVDEDGHKLIAATIANAIGLDPTKSLSGVVPETIKRRQNLLRDSWLSEIGHQRPGIKAGKPVAEANRIAENINLLIAETLKKENEQKKAK